MPTTPVPIEPRPIGMVRASPGQDLHLLAGEMHFGNTAATVRTLLGSCVAVTLWHPQYRLGGMCHFLLPQRRRLPGEPADARYADEALALLVAEIERAGTWPADYEAHLFGGADTMPGRGPGYHVGARNIETGRALIKHYGFSLQDVDVGEHVPRHVQLSFTDGQVLMRRGASMRS